jgi:hypothetical protein
MPEMALGFISGAFRTVTGLESDWVGLTQGAGLVGVMHGQRMDPRREKTSLATTGQFNLMNFKHNS